MMKGIGKFEAVEWLKSLWRSGTKSYRFCDLPPNKHNYVLQRRAQKYGLIRKTGEQPKAGHCWHWEIVSNIESITNPNQKARYGDLAES